MVQVSEIKRLENLLVSILPFFDNLNLFNRMFFGCRVVRTAEIQFEVQFGIVPIQVDFLIKVRFYGSLGNILIPRWYYYFLFFMHRFYFLKILFLFCFQLQFISDATFLLNFSWCFVSHKLFSCLLLIIYVLHHLMDVL